MHVERSKVNMAAIGGIALEPLHLWTSSTDELFYIEQRLCGANVWHVAKSWAEATEHSKFTRQNGPTALFF